VSRIENGNRRFERVLGELKYMGWIQLECDEIRVRVLDMTCT
jgi:hypothetical protein